jgi:hypothetical protein
MNVKEISKNLRMLDTKFANAKKHLAALGLEQDAEESIIETLDAQHLVLAKKLMEPQMQITENKAVVKNELKAGISKQLDDAASIFLDDDDDIQNRFIEQAASNGVHVEMPKV